MSGNPTRIAPPKFDQRNEQHTRSSVETRLRASESLLDNEVRLFKANLTLANGANANVTLPSVARFLRVTGPTAAFSISGFTGGYEGKRLIVYNPTAFAMTLTNDATSTAANRLYTLTGGDVTLPGTSLAKFIYAVDDLRWILEGTSVDNDATELAAIQAQLTALDNATSGTNTGDQFYRGYLGGLGLSYSNTTTLGIAAGQTVNDAQAAMLTLGSAYTKTTASWALGTGNGALDTGSVANSTSYHVYLIQRSDTSVVDVLFSTSASSPTMPANYDRKRRIGSFVTNSSAQVVSFSQVGDEFLFTTVPAVASTTSLSTTPANLTTAVPTGFKFIGIFNISIDHATGATTAYVYSPDQADQAAADAVAPLSTVRRQDGGVSFAGNQRIRVNTSAQVRAVSNLSSTTLRIATLGWVDRRGRDD
jgi:hypothetical protein